MDFEQLISRVALSLGIGLLIGLERGWRTREAEPGQRAAGVRTFAITGLLGGAVGAIARTTQGGVTSVGGALIVAAGFVAYAAAMTIFSLEANRSAGTYSATTAIAGMLTFVLGAYALVGDMRIAAAAAVGASIILATRETLHAWLTKITWPELRSALVLLAMTFVALPILPDDRVGPFGGVNPREVWIIAIVLACVSFAGYVAVKALGASRGVLIAAAVGGIVSSTAVTVTNARRAATGEKASNLLAAGVAVATAVSFLRVLAIAAALQPRILLHLGPALVAAAIAAVAVAALMVFRTPATKQPEHELQFRNPFGFWSVIGFAIFLGLITVLGRAAGESFGAPGAVASAILVGIADVDSVTVSMARLMPNPLTPDQAVYAILAGVASNTVSKIAIGAVIGRGWFAAKIALMALICLAVGAVVLGLSLALFAG